ncbi:MAG: formylglycine-generating enzyme family protein [Bacteroidia bacterium]
MSIRFNRNFLKPTNLLIAICLFSNTISAQNKTASHTVKSSPASDTLHSKFIIRLCAHAEGPVKINGQERAKLKAGDSVKVYFKTGSEMPYRVIVYNCISKKNTLVYPVKESDFKGPCVLDLDVNAQKESMASKLENPALDSLLAFSILNLENDMVLVKGGTFNMGLSDTSDEEEGEDARPPHKVTLHNFYISKYEVTQALWLAVMDTNPAIHKDCYLCPVDNVSWNEAQYFISKLNALTKFHYRLATEAEWEYAARGGSGSKGYEYSGSNDVDEACWCHTASGTHPAGLKKANESGLYDMSGNIAEWCSDWYGSYTRDAQVDPQGPASGTLKVVRGGSWINLVQGCTVTMRMGVAPSVSDRFMGFRLVRDVK